MRRRRKRGARRTTVRTFVMTVAGAVFAPVAWAARHVLTHPVLPHAIAAPRRVLGATSVGRISYYEDDGASGLPVVLLHDVGPIGSAYALRGLFDALRVDRPVIAPDLPGYGFSERRTAGFARDDYVSFVEELVADVSRRYGATVDVVAVGASGEIAASAVVLSSRHVRSLTIVSPTGFGRASRVASRLSRLRRVAARPFVADVVHRACASRVALRMTLSRRSRVLDEGLVRYARSAALQPRARPAIVAAVSGALSAPDVVASVYDAVRVPTCFVHGSEAPVSRSEIDLLVAGHDAFRRSEIRGARAMPHVERPAETAGALRVFWRGLAVKPQLRLIRGERSTRALGAPRRGALANPRRRSWT